MFNNNKFSQKHLADVLLRPELLLPPATPEFPDTDIIELPQHIEKEHVKSVSTDENLTAEKEPETNKRLKTFGGLLKKLGVLPVQPRPLKVEKAEDPESKSPRKPRGRRAQTLKQLKKAKRKIGKCWKRFMIFVDSVKALFSRVLYILHAILSVWRVTEVIGQWYWVVGSWLACMVVEMGFVIFKRQGKEWKWIQPCLLIYFMVELPSIWLLELVKLNETQHERNVSNPILEDIIQKHKTSEFYSSESLSVAGLTISNDWWALLLEQSMLVLIIIVRWLMPKGDMSREQLSALLLFYLGTASDIVDFFSVIAEDPELSTTNYAFLFTIMGFWSWSMLQFIFVVTMTNSEEDDKKNDDSNGLQDQKQHLFHQEEEEENLTCKQKTVKNIKIFLGSEVWAILVSMLFQDGPYAIIRVVCVFHWNIRTYTNYFFTFKNIMILLLQIYRLISVYEDHHKKQKEEKRRRKEERKNAWRFAIRETTKNMHAESRDISPEPAVRHRNKKLSKVSTSNVDLDLREASSHGLELKSRWKRRQSTASQLTEVSVV